MKLKYFFLVILSLGLYACPEPEAEVFNVNSIDLEFVGARNRDPLEENKIIKSESCVVLLSFKTSEFLASLPTNSGNVCYAALGSEPILNNRIISVTIQATPKYNDAKEIYDILEPYIGGLERPDMSIEEACEFMASTSHNKKISEKYYWGGYFKLLKKPESNFTGKFIIKLEFEDGTILQDSTQTITISP